MSDSVRIIPLGGFDKIGMNMTLMESGEDMYDSTHLNYYGSCKFTDYLAEDLRRMYGYELIPDHRGDPDYYTWDENVEMIREDVLSYGFEWR